MSTRQKLRGQGKGHKFWSPYERKSVEAPIDKIVERPKSGWLAKGKDKQGRPLRGFVARGTKRE